MSHPFLNIINEKVVIFDGAMGTELIKRGLNPGECPELWNIEKPDIIETIHKSYIEAGAEVIETNTFGANRIKLSHFGLSDKVGEINFKAVQIAKKAAAGKAFVALSVGPTGVLVEPYGPLNVESAIEVFKNQISSALEAKPDIILIETMSQLSEARAAVIAAKELCDLPVIATMTFEESGKTLMGTDPATALFVLSSAGADVVGINCSLGPDKIAFALQEMSKYKCTPILVQPNAGMPVLSEGKTIYPLSPEEFAKSCVKLSSIGLNAIGGCCGTTPEHIKFLKHSFLKIEPLKVIPFLNTVICSDKKTIVLSGKDPVKIIGERINPTGKKALSEELKSGKLSGVIREAVLQKNAGADILDVNLGVPEIDETSLMKKVIPALQEAVNIPLSIDSSNPDTLEAGLRVYTGRALVNSVNGSKESLEKVLPIIKKYGAVVIGLTMDESGIPKTASERLEIAKKIIKAAENYGIPKQNVIIDCLCLTAGTQQEQALETIKAIKLIKEELGCLTTLGISNISYGLPRRNLLNRAFLSMALSAGLDLPIINPLDNDLLEIIKAGDVLTGRDKNASLFISFAKTTKDRDGEKQFLKENMILQNSPQKKLYEAILNGNNEEVEKPIEELLLSYNEPYNIINQIIIPALKEVGEKYEKGDYFIPELLLSAEAAKKAFEIIKRKIPSGEEEKKGRIILATVKGDIHDLGKNIVKAIMENYGFDVIDLGVDVDAEIILNEARKYKDLKLIGLSALMTTSVPSMETTIKLLKNKIPNCKVIVGGAILNKDIAEKIGADFYAKDALEGVRIAEKVYEKN
ncbi:homocysteine S-methyltransferase family protein [Thermovenabulum sp.]|uniref:homocysteine S-methyltransferase family protein n=1 Tax=Thermovenabulum sp. TaxID=3100335 RepID=UPI003C7A4401